MAKPTSSGKRGGKRRGAGRKPLLPDIAPLHERVEAAAEARRYFNVALDVLVEVATNDQLPPAARVTAAEAIINRGYGRPPQGVEHSGKDGEKIQLEVQHGFDSLATKLNELASVKVPPPDK